MGFDGVSEEELFDRYKNGGDIGARNEILERNLYIAGMMASKFSGRGIDREDLYQTASLALVHAIDRFDISRGIKFNTFATPCVIGEIKNYFRDTARMVRIPRADGLLIRKLADAMEEYQAAYGESPGVRYLADRLGTKEEKVLELLEMKRTGNIVSLDADIDENGDSSIIDMVGSEDAGFSRIENRDFFLYCMSLLDESEKKIVIERYVNRRTQSDVAQMLGVSQMQVSRLEKKILNKLKTKL